MFNFPYTNFHELNLDWVIEAFNTVQGQIDAIAGLTADAESTPPSTNATVTVSGGSGKNDPYNLHFGLPRGLTGQSVLVDNTGAEYAVSDSGVVPPESGWLQNIPNVGQGQYLWTRITITFRDEQTTHNAQFYTVARQGIDGEGSVKSVNNINPDGAGNVSVPAILYTPQTLNTSDRATARQNINGAPSSPTLFISPNGDDSAPGTAEAPLKTFERALSLTTPNDDVTIVFLAGEYTLNLIRNTAARLNIRFEGSVTINTTQLQVEGNPVVVHVPDSSVVTINTTGEAHIRIYFCNRFYVWGGGRIIFNTPNKIGFTVDNSDLVNGGVTYQCSASTVFEVKNGVLSWDFMFLDGSCTTVAKLYGGMFMLGGIKEGFTYTNAIETYSSSFGRFNGNYVPAPTP